MKSIGMVVDMNGSNGKTRLSLTDRVRRQLVADANLNGSFIIVVSPKVVPGADARNFMRTLLIEKKGHKIKIVMPEKINLSEIRSDLSASPNKREIDKFYLVLFDEQLEDTKFVATLEMLMKDSDLLQIAVLTRDKRSISGRIASRTDTCIAIANPDGGRIRSRSTSVENRI